MQVKEVSAPPAIFQASLNRFLIHASLLSSPRQTSHQRGDAGGVGACSGSDRRRKDAWRRHHQRPTAFRHGRDPGPRRLDKDERHPASRQWMESAAAAWNSKRMMDTLSVSRLSFMATWRQRRGRRDFAQPDAAGPSCSGVLPALVERA